MDKDKSTNLSKSEFVKFLGTYFNKGTDEEVPFFILFNFTPQRTKETIYLKVSKLNLKYEELFDNIDVTQSGTVDWDKFASYILIMLYESDDRLKAFSIPNWKPIKQVHKYASIAYKLLLKI